MDAPIIDEITGILVVIASLVVGIIIIILAFSVPWREPVDISDLEDVIMYFHTDPDYDDFSYVMKYSKRLPQKTFKCWLYGVSLSQPHYIDYYAETMQLRGVNTVMTEQSKREVQRVIRRAQTNPSAELLDCVWAIYFGSGQSKFSDIVANVGRGNIIAAPSVVAAASWSYNSIMGVPVA